MKKTAVLVSLAVFMVASSFAAETNLSTEIDVSTNEPSVTLSVSNDTVVVESDGTNQPARDIIEDPVNVEASKYAMLWKLITAVVTLVIVWGFGKIPQLPNKLLPFLSLAVGAGLTFVLDLMNGLNLPWWDGAAAGGLAVLIREAYNQNVTKPIEKRNLEKNFNATVPSDKPIP